GCRTRPLLSSDSKDADGFPCYGFCVSRCVSNNAVAFHSEPAQESTMKVRLAWMLAASILLGISYAEAQDREPGWDIGAEVIYQDSTDVSFEGGTRLAFDADWGVAIAFGYRFNERLE